MKITPVVFLFAPQMVGKITGLWTSRGTVVGVLGLYIAGVPLKGQIGADERTRTSSFVYAPFVGTPTDCV